MAGSEQGYAGKAGPRGPICWVVALKPEADPILERYRMTRLKDAASSFPVWKSEAGEHWLVVSGVGKKRASEATLRLYGCAGDPVRASWINAGIAGHREWPPGTVRRVDRIVEAAGGDSFVLSGTPDGGLAPAGLVCVDEPVDDYPADGSLVDMESAGFYAMAERIAPVRDRIVSVKVVSDNAENHHRTLTPRRVRELMEILVEKTEALVAQLSA